MTIMTRLAKTVMVQGTASNVGKSVVATALCRILKRNGFRVAPFKAQNMANNSQVTEEGGAIGTAQAVQAEACGLAASPWMNPILLKPNSDTTSQVIILGKVAATLTAREYQRRKKDFFPYVDEALNRLRQEFDVVVIEGAGSPVEINLKHDDIVNMAVAKRVSSPVILVGDIDRGGVFAQIVGTFELLEPEERNLVRAFLINKFRGDKDILKPGIEWIEKKIQRRSLGVLPMMADLRIKEEDSVVLEDGKSPAVDNASQKLLIHVIRLPRISNFTDFEPLARERDVILEYVREPQRHRCPDLLIIPGTKSTMADLAFLRESGWDNHVKRCVRRGSAVLGICGGYQMMGQSLHDPHHVESAESDMRGLELLPVVTRFNREKTTVQVKAVHLESQLPVAGYEIHMGETQNLNGARPLFQITERQGKSVDAMDGLTSGTGGARLWGTYIHGLFDLPGFRRHFLDQIREHYGLNPFKTPETSPSGFFENPYDRLARTVEDNIDMNLLSGILEEQLL